MAVKFSCPWPANVWPARPGSEPFGGGDGRRWRWRRWRVRGRLVAWPLVRIELGVLLFATADSEAVVAAAARRTVSPAAISAVACAPAVTVAASRTVRCCLASQIRYVCLIALPCLGEGGAPPTSRDGSGPVLFSFFVIFWSCVQCRRPTALRGQAPLRRQTRRATRYDERRDDRREDRDHYDRQRKGKEMAALFQVRSPPRCFISFTGVACSNLEQLSPMQFVCRHGS